MKPQELKNIRTGIYLTQRELGYWCNPTSSDMGRTIRRWEQGARTIPENYAVLFIGFHDGFIPRHIHEHRSRELLEGTDITAVVINDVVNDLSRQIEENYDE